MKPECRESLERAYLFLDGELLSEQERALIELHLEACGPCYERYGLERDIAKLVSRLRGAQRCPADLRSRIQALLWG
jgi:mycothiol system anti-sigma-R factor